MAAWAAEEEVGAAGVDVVDELVLLDVVAALVVEVVGAAEVEVELELELEELAPEVVLVLDEFELPVVGAIEVVVSATVDDGAAVVSVVGDSAWVGSVTAADLGDSDWALAFESSSAVIPPMPVGLSPSRWPSIRSATLSSDPLDSPRPA